MKFKPAEKSGGMVVELGPKEIQLPRTATGQTAAMLPAFNLKNILVPVDFTECTPEALMYAVAFAKQFQAKLTLLHVIEPAYLPPSELGGVEIIETKSEAKAQLEKLQQTHLGQVRSEILVKRGNAEQEIIAAASETESNLILLATHGRTGFSRMLLGSTAEHVVRHAHCPVLIVRPEEREFVEGLDSTVTAKTPDTTPELEAQMISGL